MAFGDGFSMQEYVQSHGKDLYRRSMYTFWKRTVPPAVMATFDAPDREKCVARRAVTNTPLQALVTLNDPTYVEAARAMAERTLREGGKNLSGRIVYVFRLALARNPSAQEARDFAAGARGIARQQHHLGKGRGDAQRHRDIPAGTDSHPGEQSEGAQKSHDPDKDALLQTAKGHIFPSAGTARRASAPASPRRG